MSNQPPAPPPPPGDTGGMPPPPSGSPQGTAGADVGIRVGARLIDSIILWIVSLIIITPLVFTALFADSQSGGMMSTFGGGGFGIGAIVASLLSLAIWLAYYALFDSRMGGTPGKKILKLEVRGPDGTNPTIEESLKRNAWMVLSIVPFVGGLLQLAAAIYILVTISRSDANVGWHDEFAGGTRVVRN